MKTLAALAFLLITSTANATTGTFGGSIDRLSLWPTLGSDYDLGIKVGDGFSGVFSYDTAGIVSVFTAVINGTVFQSTRDMVLGLTPDDGRLSYLYITGEVQSLDLWMSIALTASGRSGILDSAEPPAVIDSDDWYVGCFKLGDRHRAGVEDLCWLTDDTSIIGARFGMAPHFDSDFFMRTDGVVPEPSAWLLVGLGLIVAVVAVRVSAPRGESNQAQTL